MNSMGSSMVTMCSRRSVLILSIIAASVVDLPDPVGPVTRIEPPGLRAQFVHDRRKPQFLKRAYLVGDQPECPGQGAPLHEDVRPESTQPPDAEGKVQFLILLEPMLLSIGENAVAELPGFLGFQRRIVQAESVRLGP